MIDYSKISLGENCCWIYNSHNFGHGYRGATHDGKCIVAHRVMWIEFFGPIPEGLCVLHDCDNRPCINPFHLFLGTKGDNNMDTAAKGRTHRHFGNQWNVGKKLSKETCDKKSAALKGKPWSTLRRAAYERTL